MQEITTIGLDLAKSVFQVHATGSDGKIVLLRQLRRAQMLAFFSTLAPCHVWMAPAWQGVLCCSGVWSVAAMYSVS